MSLKKYHRGVLEDLLYASEWWLMDTLHGLIDLKNTFAGKFLATLVSFALVFSIFNISAFAEGDEQVPATDDTAVEQPATPSGEAGSPDNPESNAGDPGQGDTGVQPTDPSSGSSEGAEDASGQQSGGQSSDDVGDPLVVQASEAVVSFVFQNSYAKVADQTVTYPQESLKVALHKEMKFVPAADTGYELTAVTAKNASSGEEVALGKEDGVYTVPADAVDSNLVIEVKSEKEAVPEGDTSLKDENPAAMLLGSAAATSNTVKVAVDGTITLNGSNPGAAAHEWSMQGKEDNPWDLFNSSVQNIVQVNGGTVYAITSLSLTGKNSGTITIVHRWGTSKYGSIAVEQGREAFTVEVGTGGSEVEPEGLVSLSPSVLSLEQFATATLKPVFEPESSYAQLAWSSSDSSVASVNARGGVTAVNVGQATITAALPGTDFTASAQVTVTKSQAQGTKAYFYVMRPDAQPGDLGDSSWLYVGEGSINVSNLYNTLGYPFAPGAYDKQMSLDVNNRVISYPDEARIKASIAKLYNVSSDQVEISFTPYKITCPAGAVDENGRPILGAAGYCYHVDMTVSIKTPEKASATYYLWDADSSGYQPVENYVLDRGDSTSPQGEYPESKKDSSGTLYRFDGWYDNEARTGTPVSFPCTVDGGATFYAKYLAMPAYKVFYDGGADDATMVPSDPDVYDVGARVTVKSAPQRLGYEFTGWLDGANGEMYQPGDLLVMPFEDVTLTAQWVEHVDMVTLTYDANGATGSVPDPEQFEAGTVVPAADLATGDGLTNGNATFKGWSETPDGLTPVESVSMSADKTLYAIWVETYAIAYEVYTYPNQESATTPDFVETHPQNVPETVEVKAGTFDDDDSAEAIRAHISVPDTIAYPEYGIEWQNPGDAVSDVDKAYNTSTLDKDANKITVQYANKVYASELSDGAVSVKNADGPSSTALRQGMVTVKTHYVDASGTEIDHAKLSGSKQAVYAPAVSGANTSAGPVTEQLYFAWQQNDNKVDLTIADTDADDGWMLNSVVCSDGSGIVRNTGDAVSFTAVGGNATVDIYLTPEYTVNYFEATGGSTTQLTDKTQVATLPVAEGRASLLPDGIVAADPLSIQALPEKPGYSYSGWNTSETMDGTAYAAGSSLALSAIDSATHTINLYAAGELVQYQVSYQWSGLPDAQLYDADGNKTAPQLPDTLTGLTVGDRYDVDGVYAEGSTVYTQDGFGNRTASYTFGGWTDPGDGTISDHSITVSGTWAPSAIAVPVNNVTYDWGTENVPGGVALPSAITGLKPNQHYAIDTDFSAGTAVNQYDEYGNVTGVYTFSGWDDPNDGIMGADSVTVTGSWSYETKDVAAYNVVYAWDLPSNTSYFDENGTALDPLTLPASLTGLVKGQPYEIDDTYKADESVVYLKDAYGNIDGAYTFKGWNDPGNGVMGEANVTVAGTWEFSPVEVETHSVSYAWDLPDDVPFFDFAGASVDPALPGAATGLVSGQPYEVDSVYGTGSAVYTHDEYGNVNGTYTFGGWTKDGVATSGTQIMGDADVALEGAWTYSAQTVTAYPVTYEWNLPSGTVFYDQAGNQTAPVLPVADPAQLVPGQKFTVDTTYPAEYTVYTHDEYGNVNGTYTFGGWDASGEQTMGSSAVVIHGAWTPASVSVAAHGVSYEWTGLPDDGTGLFSAAGDPLTPTVPAAKDYVKGQKYQIDDAYAQGFEVYTHDAYGNVNGAYTFSGWKLNDAAMSGIQTMGDGDILYEGEWAYSEKTVTAHVVSYQWNLPLNATYYNAAGGVDEAVKPSAVAGLVSGQPYSVDAKYASGYTVYTHDAYGNVNGSYTFGGWDDPNGGTMGDADVTVTGSWTPAPIEVPANGVSYEWNGLPVDGGLFDADGNAAAPELPDALENLVKGQPYTVDSGYSAGFAVYTHDAYGNVNGSYTFGGWTKDGVAVSGEQTMGDASVALSGEWTYREQAVVSYPVTYAWDLPENTVFYDATGSEVALAVPLAEPARLVPGQPYTVDTVYFNGYEVYTHDAYGNVNGSYTFGGWDASGEQTMGSSAVVIHGAWTPASVSVAAHGVSYEWTGLPDDGTPLFDAAANPAAPDLPAALEGLVKGQPYAVDGAFVEGIELYTHDAYGNVNGSYTFGGWTKGGSAVSGEQTMGDADVTLSGKWSHSDKTVVSHNVFYEWDLPEDGACYDQAGEAVGVVKPSTMPGLVSGQPYSVDAKYASGYTVYTHDIYGNVNGSYEFGGWDDPGNGVMDDADVTVTGTWTPVPIAVEEHSVTYAWSGLPNDGTLFFDADGNPRTPTLPATASYVKGQNYVIDDIYVPNYAVCTHDAYGNVNGIYTFRGWDKNGVRTMGDEDVAISGTWEYSGEAVEKRTVTYRWDNLPANATFYDATGSRISLAVPNSIAGLVPNQTYAVDSRYPEGYTVYTHDAYGNVNGSYTFGGWTLGGAPVGGTTQTMGSSDVTVEGAWAVRGISVDSHSVTYDWGIDNVPDGVTLPASHESLVPGQPYSVDATYAAGYSVNATDVFGNVTGVYTFSGWTDPGHGVMGDGDMAITGSWSYADQSVARYNVVYGWDLPDNVYYDAAGTAVDPTVPASLTGLVKGQPYTIDTLFAQGYVVYTQDENGNRNGSYTFSGWTDPNNGVMGEADVTVTGTWSYEAIAVPVPTPTPAPTPTTPDTPIAQALPPVITGPIDTVAQALQNTYETVIGEEPTPLAGPEEETISDNDTPLAGGFDVHDPACWVHFYIILGMILSALYIIVVVARRRRFISVLNGYEDSLFGRGGNAGGKGVA